ncbi:MAG: hypothetical protein ACI87E_004621, partial [Mariniblastus sp.]
MYFGVIMLLIIVTVLSAASFQGVMKFRKLTKSVRERSLELPEAAKLGRAVSDVRSTLWQITLRESQNEEPGFLDEYSVPTRDQFKDNDPLFWRLNLIEKIQIVEGAFEDYRSQLDNNHTRDPRMAEKDAELQFVADFSTSLDRIRADVDDPLFHFH